MAKLWASFPGRTYSKRRSNFVIEFVLRAAPDNSLHEGLKTMNLIIVNIRSSNHFMFGSSGHKVNAITQASIYSLTQPGVSICVGF